MKVTCVSMMVVALACFASAASADIAGRWRVTGKVSSFAFTLDCDFRPVGVILGGVCVDASTNSAKFKGGKSHALTAGSLQGDSVSWTYRSSFMLSGFDVTYKGTISGGTIRGSIDAAGHAGTFNAVRR